MQLYYTFRFHTGSIKRLTDGNTKIRLDGFDSILVRLKGVTALGDLTYAEFRFHTGSIKRGFLLMMTDRGIVMFRFHTGSIKSE